MLCSVIQGKQTHLPKAGVNLNVILTDVVQHTDSVFAGCSVLHNTLALKYFLTNPVHLHRFLCKAIREMHQQNERVQNIRLWHASCTLVHGSTFPLPWKDDSRSAGEDIIRRYSTMFAEAPAPPGGPFAEPDGASA
jgi:hypothetical protein